ncbi:MAG TPA: septal ring lytic transglycosylase RlpA family protein [Acidimicrobiales bacterium]|nr:septal ring lytic transglycosylase RlpA family protein [Acidimicrobiales bacterium]
MFVVPLTMGTLAVLGTLVVPSGHAAARVVVSTVGRPDRLVAERASRSRLGMLDAEQIQAIAAGGRASVVVVPTAATPTPTTTPHAVVRRVTPASTTTTTRPRPTTTTTEAPTTTTTAPPGHSETGQASWYNGPAGQCANNSIPFGTVVTVTNLANGASTQCTVESRGPYEGGRIIDLTEATFSQIASPSQGVINVRIQW